MVRGIPGYIGGLHVAVAQPGVVVRIAWRRHSHLTRLEVARPFRVMGRDCPIALVLILPDPGVPLANNPAPVLDIDLRRTAAYAELHLLVASLGRSQKID